MKEIEHGYIPTPEETALARERWDRTILWWASKREMCERQDDKRHERYGRGNLPSTGKVTGRKNK